MELLYQDNSLWVAVKPPELLSEMGDAEHSFAARLAAENKGYVGVVHRLDRGVGGVMVYAKTADAAARLSLAVQSRQVQKEYLAVVHGCPECREAELCDLLFHDRNVNKTYVVDRERRGVKKAILSYRVQETVEDAELGRLSLLRVTLQTGRTHQIRAQLSHAGYPLLGDRKYGSPAKAPIALFSCRLAFVHPMKKGTMDFSHTPQGGIWDHFSTLKGTER